MNNICKRDSDHNFKNNKLRMLCKNDKMCCHCILETRLIPKYLLLQFCVINDIIWS